MGADYGMLMYSDGIRIVKFECTVADRIKDMRKISGREEAVKNVNCAKQMKEEISEMHGAAIK